MSTMSYNCPLSVPQPYDSPSTASTAPLTSSLPALLTASVVVLAMDATMHLLRWRSQERVSIPTPAQDQRCQTLTRVAARAERVVIDFRELEKQLALEGYRRKCQTMAVATLNRERRLIYFGGRNWDNCDSPVADGLHKEQISNAFAGFCERLLLENRVWKQEKEMKQMMDTLESQDQARNGAAFKTFCDQLLLWNRIWKLEKEVNLLVAEGERLKRSRVAAITRAAKRMVLDVQKERLIEEFVKDMIDEVEEGKREVRRLRAAHEREVEEINGDWLKDCRTLVRELEQLKAGREARLVEQEVANEMEQALCESLGTTRQRVDALENRIRVYEGRGYASAADDTLVENRDDENSDADVSDSSTCVSVGRTSGRMITGRETTGNARLPGPLDKHMPPLRRFVAHDKAGLLLKPLILDHADAISMSPSTKTVTGTCSHPGRTHDPTTLVSPWTAASCGTAKRPQEPVKRLPWRV